jgi:uncharacterized protein (DUF1778 family)
MTKTNSKVTKAFSLRVTKSLLEALEVNAAINNRSMSNFIVCILMDYICGASNQFQGQDKKHSQ